MLLCSCPERSGCAKSFKKDMNNNVRSASLKFEDSVRTCISVLNCGVGRSMSRSVGVRDDELRSPITFVVPCSLLQGITEHDSEFMSCWRAGAYNQWLVNT